ncbi:MAG: ParB N-terminal domain-containing protein [Kiritimatiellia bacterium]|jgi:ParB family chromosome partitioning protein|nr:ParB N-terminal domain-containing protein [Kiritimatiellia bacterium]
MQISVNSVVIKERVRTDVGDLTTLMDSMQKFGQMSPIVVTRKHELIAGNRRLLSARRLGWYTIDAVVVDRESPADKLEMELAENVNRKDFSPEELLMGYRRLEKLRRPGVGVRIRQFFGRLFGRIFKRGGSRQALPSEQQSPMEATAGDL